MCVFQGKTGHISKTVKAKVTINQIGNRILAFKLPANH